MIIILKGRLLGKMSSKIVNGKEMYTLERVAMEFGGCENRSEARDFIFFIECKDIITKTAFTYKRKSGERAEYVYHPSIWFAELMDGHFYAKPMIRKGIQSNGTLYFDKFAAMALGRFYRMCKKCKTKKVIDAALYEAIARTALDKFIEKI